jgi:hypothetical protein
MRRWVELCVLIIASQAVGQTQPETIAIRTIEGDGAINSIRLRRGHDPVVRVVDSDGEPLSGATVSFLLPATGPSGSFPDGGLSLTLQTDSRGMAAAHGLRPNGVAGQFRIRVTANWRGRAAAATILQTNAEPVTASKRSKKIAIIAIIAGAAAGGAVVAARSGKSAQPSAAAGGAPAPGGSISAGVPTVGPPR